MKGDRSGGPKKHFFCRMKRCERIMTLAGRGLDSTLARGSFQMPELMEGFRGDRCSYLPLPHTRTAFAKERP